MLKVNYSKIIFDIEIARDNVDRHIKQLVRVSLKDETVLDLLQEIRRDLDIISSKISGAARYTKEVEKYND